jgi:hypothetical protein
MIEILDAASLFIFIADKDEIDCERQRLEAERDLKLRVYEVSYPTHSGTRCTRVEWEIC